MEEDEHKISQYIPETDTTIEFDKETKEFVIHRCFWRYEIDLNLDDAEKVVRFISKIILKYR